VATSLRDLLDVLDDASSPSHRPDPDDAARALRHTGTLLTSLLSTANPHAVSSGRAAAMRRLAESCADAGVSFDGRPGRVSDLVGAVGDVAGLLHRDLTGEDRWSIACGVAIPARRCAAIVATSGPYATVPELLGVADRARDLVRMAAADSFDPQLTAGLHIPIPVTGLPRGLPASRVTLESLAEVVGTFRERGRDPMSLRQLIAVTHAAEQTTAAARSVGGGERRVLLCASRVIHGVDVMLRDGGLSPGPAPRDVADVHRAARLLPLLAQGCEREIARIGPTLIVSGGDRPIHDDRVAEWLQRRPAMATPPDLYPAVRAARHARAEAIQMNSRLEGPERSWAASPDAGAAFQLSL
jgi:hypothetical protein